MTLAEAATPQTVATKQITSGRTRISLVPFQYLPQGYGAAAGPYGGRRAKSCGLAFGRLSPLILRVSSTESPEERRIRRRKTTKRRRLSDFGAANRSDCEPRVAQVAPIPNMFRVRLG